MVDGVLGFFSDLNINRKKNSLKLFHTLFSFYSLLAKLVIGETRKKKELIHYILILHCNIYTLFPNSFIWNLRGR